MEPPAVTSCGVGGHSVTGQHPQTQKRDNSHVGFLQIEPQISFNTNSRHFEELPENFLETMSPQQHAGHVHPLMMSSSISIGGNTHDVIVHSTTSPQLASLTTVSMAGGSTNGNSGYANLISMPSSSHYISTLKMESMEHLGPHSQLQSSQMEKTTFGNGPAGLLSPLQLESNRNDTNSLGLLAGIHHHSRPNGGRTSDLLSGIRRNDVSYVKEEMNASEIGYQTTHDYDGNYSLQQPTQQELERMANAETPPALSNVEITSSILASLSNDSPSPNIQHQQSSPQTHFIVHQMPRQQQIIHQAQSGSRSSGSRKSKQQNHQQETQRLVSQTAINIDTYGSIGSGTALTNYPQLDDINDPLNAEIDDEIYIDTKDLCKRVAYELKQHSIPQAIFAERILCRSQGTLSDLLRNPKPWNRLKSGRETFKRMYNWLQQPLHTRLNILDMFKGPMPSNVVPPPTPAQNSRHHHRRRTSTGEDGQAQKRPRLVFTDIQKRTLQAIFKETQRPSREMQQTIAEHLRLDMSTVSNFFMNARRRSRNGNGLGDEPAPYQQIRTITPPPDSPPTAQQDQMSDEHQQQQQNLQTTRKNKSSSISHQTTSASNLSHIEQTVDEVVGRSIAYARKSQYAPAISQTIIDNQQPVWEEVQIQIETEMSFDESGVIIQDNLETGEMLEEDGENNNKNEDTADHILEDIDGKKLEVELNSENDRKSVERETEKIKEEVELEEGTPKNKEISASNPKNESPVNDGQASTAPGTPTKCDEPENDEDANKNEGSDDNKNDRGEDEASASVDDNL